MGKLVGLLGAGISLAVEAASEYHSNKSAGKRSNTHLQQDLTYVSRDPNYDEKEDQRDAKAFQELQNYADFQRLLSNRVQDDLYREEMFTSMYTPIDPRILGQRQAFGDYFSHQPFVHPSLQQPRPPGRLQFPVIIPQRRPEDKSRGWVRAYAPALMNCGIDQYTFLNFLDSFNESSKSSPFLDVVNVAGLGVGFALGITPLTITMAVSIAMRITKKEETEKKTTDFLARANDELFIPHGLFAMVLTYKPGTTSQAYAVDISQPPSLQTSSSSIDSPHLPTNAPLIFPEPEPTGSTGQQNKFKQIGNFIADYGDRRAQAKYAYEHPDSTLATPPLGSPILGRPRERDGRRKERKEKRRGKSSSATNGEAEAKKRGLAGSVKGMISGPGKEEKAFFSRLRGREMKKDVLYLLIVNAPDSSSTPFLAPPAPMTPDPYPYDHVRDTKRFKSPSQVLELDPLQQPWSSDSGLRWLTNEKYVPGNRGRSPPSVYSNPQKSAVCEKQDENREGEYCVPTL